MKDIGSIWRKWDLHFHTPSSFDYIDKSISNQEIIDNLALNNISVVAITDHHLIDVNRIIELQKIGKTKNITVLPGIEFRSELGGSEIVHFIGIFPENSNIEEIWIDLQSACNLKPSQVSEIGDEKLYVDLKETSKLIHELGGLVTVHAGKKTNTIENIKNNHDYKLKIKTDLLNDSVDILEIGNPAIDIEGYKNIVFPQIKIKLPLILCSDNHNVKDYKTKSNLWIKGDPTYEGLLQTIYEPDERVKIQESNPQCDFSKPFFKKIIIETDVNIFQNETIKFEKQEIIFNPNLVTIIGGRGEGKSVLIDYFAHGFGLNPSNTFSFSESFKVKYSKGICTDDYIDYSFDNLNNLNFLYISQNEVKDIALSHKKLGDEIRNLLKLNSIGFSSQIQEEISKILKDYYALKNWFNDTNPDGTKINDKETLNKIKKRNEDLLNSITNKENRQKLELYTENIKEIRVSEIQKTRIEKLISKLKEFETEINKELNEIDKEITSISFKNQLDELNIIYENLSVKIKENENENSLIKEQFSEIYKGDLSSLLESADNYKSQIETIKEMLKEIEKQEEKFALISKDKNAIPTKINSELLKQVDIINKAWSNIIEGHSSWLPEQKDLMKQILADREIEINGKLYFDSEKFYDGLKNCINGKYWRNKNKEGELEQYFNISDASTFFIYLENELEGELIANSDSYYINETEEFFYKLEKRQEYLYVQPEITYKSKTLDKISVGQRGTVYLCLKLATSAFSTPIIYDQPEDDLDNQFIINELVGIFKSIKKYRQVIIVTHNANLVINSDAEQVIIAKNSDEVLSYSSGAIENEVIIDSVCKILEGGKSAFEQRKNRYKV
ncbi:MAG: hypothetical protein A2W99_03845 [Bacteroidetes bacterium GWF2_33_16]|nr:MAG: hypothetical protein A2X00_12255 [Bacteroidetes bacterium GWE2_32_14]OFY03626.1 MAG: hypothetical protein A2W99_03845 [Bacteroidetes bacterium GWF2_33_16]